MEFTPENQAELTAMMNGQDGGIPFEKVLIESALGPYLSRIGEGILRGYFAGTETADAVLAKIRELDQPEPVTTARGFSPNYKQTIADPGGTLFP